MSDADFPAVFTLMVFAAFAVLSIVAILETLGVIKR